MRLAHVAALTFAVSSVAACSPGDGAKLARSRAALAAGLVQAQPNATLGAPACDAIGSGCTTGALVAGRGPLGPELGAPNTIGGSCADGASGQYRSDESLEQLSVESLDGRDLAAGQRVRVTAVVWAYAAYAADALDLYAAADALAPSWQLVATIVPPGAGLQTLTAEYTLPAGARQAVRGVFRYGGAPSTCPGGPFDEADDLAFPVAGAWPGPPVAPEIAGWDAALGVPACTAAGAACSSGDLLRRGADGSPEPNAPNTLHASCTDATAPGPAPSVEAIALESLDGAPLQGGKAVRVSVDASGLAPGMPLDLFLAPDADAPAFALVTRWTATGGAAERHEITLALPPGGREVLRAVAAGAASPLPCGGADQDDLVFATALVDLTAAWDAGLGVPACFAEAHRCDSGALLAGRGWLTPEAHTPNTLDHCMDGGEQVPAAGSDPSVEALRVTSLDGPTIRAMRNARVEATVRAPAGTPVDLFVADLAGWPWRYLGRVAAADDGVQTVGVAFTVRQPGLAAVRAVLADPLSPWEQPCASSYPRSDVDDLAFTAAPQDAPGDAAPPTATLRAPGPDAAVATFPLHLAVDATDDVLVQRVEYWVNGQRVGMVFDAPYEYDWTPAAPPPAGAAVDVSARVFDGVGAAAETAHVALLARDLTPPTVAFTSPGAGSRVPQAPLAVEVQAVDDVRGPDGVARVDLLADGVLAATMLARPWVAVWDASGSAEGPHELVAIAYDAAGNHASIAVSVVVDATPPTAAISSPVPGAVVRGVVPVAVAAEDPGGGGTLGVVRIDGIARGYAWNAQPFAWDTAAEADGAHALQAWVRDDAGNAVVTPPFAVVVDNTPPSVALAAPAPGALVDGAVDVVAAAQDAVGIARVELSAAGVPLGVATAPPYAAVLDASALGDGVYQLVARATDAAGNVAVASIPVLVDRTPPAVAVTWPKPVTTLRRTVTLQATASDANGIARVEFWARDTDYVNTVFALVATAAPAAGPAFQAEWDTTQVQSGRYAVYARALDGAGREAASAAVTDVVVDNSPPSVYVTSPADAAQLAGKVPVTIGYKDFQSYVPWVQYVVDGDENVSWVDPAYVSFTWDTTRYADGPHTLRVRAQDAAGNVGDSATIQVRIANGAGGQLLANTGFESGPGPGWAAKTSAVVNASSAQPAHAGLYKASLCGRGYAYSDYVKQQFNVPPGATKLAVRLWLLVRTSEGLSYAYDRLFVRLYGQNGALVSTLATFSNMQGGTAWVERALTVIDVTALRGQTVTLALEATEDSTLQTTFHVDDVTATWSP